MQQDIAFDDVVGGYEGRKALFFARLDKLGDPFEGSITEVQRVLRLDDPT